MFLSAYHRSLLLLLCGVLCCAGGCRSGKTGLQPNWFGGSVPPPGTASPGSMQPPTIEMPPTSPPTGFQPNGIPQNGFPPATNPPPLGSGGTNPLGSDTQSPFWSMPGNAPPTSSATPTRSRGTYSASEPPPRISEPATTPRLSPVPQMNGVPLTNAARIRRPINMPLPFSSDTGNTAVVPTARSPYTR